MPFWVFLISVYILIDNLMRKLDGRWRLTFLGSSTTKVSIDLGRVIIMAQNSAVGSKQRFLARLEYCRFWTDFVEKVGCCGAEISVIQSV